MIRHLFNYFSLLCGDTMANEWLISHRFYTHWKRNVKKMQLNEKKREKNVNFYLTDDCVV